MGRLSSVVNDLTDVYPPTTLTHWRFFVVRTPRIEPFAIIDPFGDIGNLLCLPRDDIRDRVSL